MADLDPRARRLADDPSLRPVWLAAHRRLEATGGEVTGAAVTLRDLADDERRAVDLLLASRRRAAAVRVSLPDLDALLRDRVGAGVVDVAVAAVGPLRDRPGERARAASGLDARWAEAAAHAAVDQHAGLGPWLAACRATGRVARLGQTGHDELLRALDVLAHLPAAPPRPRGVLAAEVLGDAHALDDVQPCARLVLSALAHLAGDPQPPGDAAARRDVWLAAGVLPDDVSSTVLTLGLRPVAVGPCTDAASRWADARVPLPLPLAAVVAESWSVGPQTVHVCENPSVLAAAAASLEHPPPLVCVEGNPSLAVQTLLRQLVAGGATLRYHGDFGAGGIAIANVVIGRLGAVPWRFCAADHAEALAALGAGAARLRPLPERVPDAVWDPALAAAIVACGVEVEEEHVLGLLLGDLEATRSAEG